MIKKIIENFFLEFVNIFEKNEKVIEKTTNFKINNIK